MLKKVINFALVRRKGNIRTGRECDEKKLVCLVLCAVMASSLMACGTKSKENEDNVVVNDSEAKAGNPAEPDSLFYHRKDLVTVKC